MEIDYPIVKLESSDGKRFLLTGPEASCSKTLRVFLENLPSSTPDVIALKSVDSVMLTRVVDWCRMHPATSVTAPAPPSATGNNQHPSKLNEWERQYFKSLENEEQFFRLMHVANYLELESLYEAACQIMASRWEAKKVEEIRKQYRIHNDYSNEEEQLMKLETKRLGLED